MSILQQTIYIARKLGGKEQWKLREGWGCILSIEETPVKGAYCSADWARALQTCWPGASNMKSLHACMLFSYHYLHDNPAVV